MSVFSRLFEPKAPPLSESWAAIAALAREPRWYREHGVPDTIDGRFDMVALVTSLFMIRMEEAGLAKETATLTERFVDDMESSLREIGVGDMVVGKHVGNMVGALGGRIGAYREALKSPEQRKALAAALSRNIWREREIAGGTDSLRLADAVIDLWRRIEAAPLADLVAGRLGR